ncbi:unnamed protein product [Adineta ricciae]|uniref:6-bladed beta-propeller n=1 Tax=Adineta ricciae TaxID=249248 RepID=A0A815WGK8_ADIRI|nr:unnamed protein product [Adineta ricciae]CAF1659193.1 unnamed protein product [Adineta ricciae]
MDFFVSDWGKHEVRRWKIGEKGEGTLVAGGNGKGENLNQLNHRRGIIVDHEGRIYIADSDNDRITRWCEGDEEGEIIVGENGQGNEPNQLSYPCGLSFDGEGNLYVGDHGNHRIQRFDFVI